MSGPRGDISVNGVNENIQPVDGKYDIILPLLSDPDSNLYVILYSIPISFSREAGLCWLITASFVDYYRKRGMKCK